MKHWTIPIIITAAAAAAVIFTVCRSGRRHSLDRQIASYMASVPARVGVFVRTSGGREFGYCADDTFPMMSTFKIPVAITAMRKMERCGTPLSQPVTVQACQMPAGTYSPMRDSCGGAGITTTLGGLIAYSVSMSDNIACDLLIDYAGGVDSVARFVSQTGIAPMLITADERMMHTGTQMQRANTTSPRAMVDMLARFRDGELLAPPYCDTLMRRMVETSTGPDKLRAGLPDGIRLAHKTGSSDRTDDGIKIADNDAGIVTLPDGRSYCIAVFVCDSPLDDRANAAVIARISRMVYEYLSGE